MRAGLIVVAGCLVSACMAEATAEQLRTRAAFDLHCNAQSLQVQALDQRTRGVTGCGQQVAYVESCNGVKTAFGTQCTWVMNTDSRPAPAAAPPVAPATRAAPPVPASSDGAGVGFGVGIGGDTVPQAEGAATSWLALVDGGKFQQSWEQAAALFQGAITQPAWEKALQAARSPLGAVKSRNLKSATYARALPGAPDGEYVVIQYDSVFEHKAAATETITPKRENDGSWRVSGYYIK
jgi:hypothetical protein